MAPVSRIRRLRTVGLAPPCRGVLTLLPRPPPTTSLEGFGDLPSRGAAMRTHSLLSRLPLRAARWSATHPWRAIGAWFALVVVATSLAFVVHTQQTTDADYRLGDSGRADAMTSAAHLTHGQVESILVTE